MIAIVQPIERERPQWPVVLDAAPGAAHLLAELAGHRERADRVEEHVHLDPRAAALGQRGGDVAGRLAVFEDVLGVVDRPARAAYRGQLGREDLLTVQQDLHTIAADHRRPGVRAEGRRERRLLDVERWQLQMRTDTRAPRGDREQQGETHPRGPAARLHHILPSLISASML